MFLNRPTSVIFRYLPLSNSNWKSHHSMNFMAADTSRQRRSTMSANEARVSLLAALASQTSSLCLRGFTDLMVDIRKYAIPRRFESRNLEELLMAVPDLETVNFITLKRTDLYEIREVEPYFVAETTMPGKDGFGFAEASQSFNVLAEYLFGKNMSNNRMEMTTPVITRKSQSNGEKMKMMTPVITKKMEDQNNWSMSFVLPSKYGSNLPLPRDSSVRIKQIRKKIIAVAAFSGFVTDEEVARRELMLKVALENDPQFQVKDGEPLEVAQYNPPFTIPFTRRNEISLEVESKLE